jgi:Na+-transporting NADH:ubiquinone oxidoreductase subunit C
MPTSGGGKNAMPRDSIKHTFIVAVSVCAACSLVVSMAAVALKGFQDRNRLLDRQRNILLVAGFDPKEIDEADEVESLFAQRIKDTIIELETGEDVTSQYTENLSQGQEPRAAVQSFDQLKGPKLGNPDLAEKLSSSEDIATIKWQENRGHVYELMSADGKTVEKYIFPIRGYGLWSTLYGFICLESDLNTIAGLSFYEHGETPGLGGEVDNERWKEIWAKGHMDETGKERIRLKVYDESGNVEISVIKGQVNITNEMAEFQVDGLSGATITSNGVSNLLQFWMGDTGYKPYIEKERARRQSSEQTNESSQSSSANGATNDSNTASSGNRVVKSEGLSDG